MGGTALGLDQALLSSSRAAPGVIAARPPVARHGDTRSLLQREGLAPKDRFPTSLASRPPPTVGENGLA
jgi:hypothetical protein